MSPFARSSMAWIAGGVAGVVVAGRMKKSKFTGGLLGAMVVGAIADKAIEEPCSPPTLLDKIVGNP